MNSDSNEMVEQLLVHYPDVVRMQFLMQSGLWANAEEKLGRTVHNDYLQGVSDALWFLLAANLLDENDVAKYVELFGGTEKDS